MDPFTRKEQTAIEKAIKRAEAKTSGEIVVVVTGSSDGYRSFAIIWAALLALAIPLPLIWATKWPVEHIYLLQLATFLLFAVLFQWEPVRYALAPKCVMRARAHQKAIEQFLAQSLHTTKGRTGVLIFVSFAEHFAEIIADEGIYRKVSPGIWNDLIVEADRSHRRRARSKASSRPSSAAAKFSPSIFRRARATPTSCPTISSCSMRTATRSGNIAEQETPQGYASRRGIVSWALFDWAAQPYYTLVVTFLFGPYFVTGFMADPVRGAALWAYATGVAMLIAAVLAPVLGAIADAGFPRKPWIAAFSVVLVVGLLGLWLAIPGETRFLYVVLVSFALATIGAELATVFTNAMMPSLVPARRLGTLSGFGWAAGFVGGLISLALVAGLIVADPNTGKTLLGLNPIVPPDPATREGDRLIGPFSRAMVCHLRPAAVPVHAGPSGEAIQAGAVRPGLVQFVRALKRLVREHKQVALFLLARMLYADGLGACSPSAASTRPMSSAGARPSLACSASSSWSPERSVRSSVGCSTTASGPSG